MYYIFIGWAKKNGTGNKPPTMYLLLYVVRIIPGTSLFSNRRQIVERRAARSTFEIGYNYFFRPMLARLRSTGWKVRTYSLVLKVPNQNCQLLRRLEPPFFSRSLWPSVGYYSSFIILEQTTAAAVFTRVSIIKHPRPFTMYGACRGNT